MASALHTGIEPSEAAGVKPNYTYYEKDATKISHCDDTYMKFLRSKNWRIFKMYLYSHRGHKCELCGCTHGLQVHHVNYRNWQDPDQRKLMIVCEHCHEIITLAKKRDFDKLRKSYPGYEKIIMRYNERVKELHSMCIAEIMSFKSWPAMMLLAEKYSYKARLLCLDDGRYYWQWIGINLDFLYQNVVES